MLNIFLIAIGGALGSVSRYIVSQMVTRYMRVENFFKNSLVIFPASFPWSTFAVNVIGSLLAGIAYYLMIKYFDIINPKMKNLLMIGFLGGFTTFSTFSLDFFRLFTAGQHVTAFFYAFLSFTISILALFFGFYLTKLILT